MAMHPYRGIPRLRIGDALEREPAVRQPDVNAAVDVSRRVQKHLRRVAATGPPLAARLLARAAQGAAIIPRC